jgi:hypothetical protein
MTELNINPPRILLAPLSVLALILLVVSSHTAYAQLSQGDAVALLGGDGSATLVRISPSGTRTVLSDFKNPAQGPGSGPSSLSIESPNSVLVLDLVGTPLQPVPGGLPLPPVSVVRVSLPSGNRSIVSDIGNASQGALLTGFFSGAGVVSLLPGPAGSAYLLGGGLYRVDTSNGQRTLLSNFADASQGPTLGSWSGAVEDTGELVVVGSLSEAPNRIYRVNPTNGRRTLVGDIASASQSARFLGALSFTGGLAVETSGNILAVDMLGVLTSALPDFGTGSVWRMPRTGGPGFPMSAFNDASQGPLGTIGGSQGRHIATNAGGTILIAGNQTPNLNATIFRIDPVTGVRTVFSDFANVGQGPTSTASIVDIALLPGQSTTPPPSGGISLPSGGSAQVSAAVTGANVQVGYAIATPTGGLPPYGTAVFSVSQNGVVVSEAGVPASPPTQSGRILIDYRSRIASGIGLLDINTGIAIVNRGTSAATITYTLRDRSGQTLATGTGNLAAGAHFAKFIHEIKDVASSFNVPANFPTAVRFGSLDISSTQPLSILALRLTTNQRGETLLTTTPVADGSAALTANPQYFPQLADGGGYTTTLSLLNTSGATEAGTISVFDDNGGPMAIRETGGTTGSSFSYAIAAGGSFVLQTDGSSAATRIGWVKVTPNAGNSTPVGGGVFSYSPGGILVTESGVPSATPTTHARIYVDKSGGHDTGIAVANPGGSSATLVLSGFLIDGRTPAAPTPQTLSVLPNGHSAKFVGQVIPLLPPNFTGVVDISSSSPFVAVTLRSLSNGRGDFLLTTFPIADANQSPPSPIVFPQIAAGGGYSTQFIFIAPTGAVSLALSPFGDDGTPLNIPIR